MAQQENNSEKAQRRCCIVKYLPILPILFISGLVVSYKYIELAVLSIIMDYLTSSTKVENQRIAAIVTNLQDGLSSFFFVFVSHISETRMGCFTMITFCAAATTQGLMLLWTSVSSSAFYAVYAGLFILAIGMSGQKLSENFLQNHLEEKIEGRKESQHGSTQNKREKKSNLRTTSPTNVWMFATSGGGYVITFFLPFAYKELFKFAALLMGGTSLLFFFGYVWYSRDILSVESSLCKIRRIFVAAFRRRGLEYPTSEVFYYWKGYEQQHLYRHGEGVRLLPRVPRLFRWLDKAAIVKKEEVGLETQEEKKGKLCTVQEVRAVKSFVPMIYMGLTIFPYSLLMASEATFFVAQASIMTSQITTDDNDISVLYLLKAGARDVARFTYFVASVSFSRLDLPSFGSLRKTGTIIRIGLGIACAAVCSFVAWRVEVDRLSSNESTTVDLIPQFVLLGAAEGLIDGGLARLFHDNVAESLWSFEDSFSELVIGAGKLLIIPIVFICGSWIKKTVDTSRLDNYYLMLGILNTGLFLVFGYYSIKYAYKEKCPEDEKFTEEEILEHAHQPELQDSSPEIDTEAITSCCCECDGCICSSICHIFGIQVDDVDEFKSQTE